MLLVATERLGTAYLEDLPEGRLKNIETGQLLRWLLALICPVIIPLCSVTGTTSSLPEYHLPEYHLRLFHTHTRKRLDIVYRRGESYVPDALSALDEFLGDHRTGAVRHYDPRVFDLLHDLTAKLGRPDSEFDIVCG